MAPWTPQQAQQWLTTQIQTHFLDAALLHHAQLDPNEAGIVDIGCADGSLALAAFNQVSAQASASQTSTIPTIIGVDNCQYMITRARQRLNTVANLPGASGAIRNHVDFLHMDAVAFGDVTTATAFRARFPNGISTIFASAVFFGMQDPEIARVIRNIMALLNPNGRIIFTTCPTPQTWTSVFVLNAEARRVRAVVDIAPLDFTRWAQQQILNACQNIAGQGPTGAPVNITITDTRWLADVWQSFAASATDNRFGLAAVNTQASVEPTQGVLRHTAIPPVAHANSAAAWVTSAVIDCLATLPGPPAPGQGQQMTTAALNGGGFAGFQALLANAYGHNDTFRAVTRCTRENAEHVFTQHNINSNYPLQFAAAFVLVTIRRQ